MKTNLQKPTNWLELEDKVAIVTGGSSEIGREFF